MLTVIKTFIQANSLVHPDISPGSHFHYPVWQMKTQRHREAREPAQGHTALLVRRGAGFRARPQGSWPARWVLSLFCFSVWTCGCGNQACIVLCSSFFKMTDIKGVAIRVERAEAQGSGRCVQASMGLLSQCVPLGKSLSLSVPHFPCL